MGILQARILEWVAMPCPPPGDLPNPEIEPRSLALQADSLLFESPGKPMPCYTCLIDACKIDLDSEKVAYLHIMFPWEGGQQERVLKVYAEVSRSTHDLSLP